MINVSWKKNLNVDESIISFEVDGYLKNHGFYTSTMNPRFFGENTDSSDILEEDAPCLRLDTDDPQDRDYTMRIFINAQEVYMEVQTSYRSFSRSHHMKLEDGLDMNNIDAILDEISSM